MLKIFSFFLPREIINNFLLNISQKKLLLKQRVGEDMVGLLSGWFVAD